MGSRRRGTGEHQQPPGPSPDAGSPVRRRSFRGPRCAGPPRGPGSGMPEATRKASQPTTSTATTAMTTVAVNRPPARVAKAPTTPPRDFLGDDADARRTLGVLDHPIGGPGGGLHDGAGLDDEVPSITSTPKRSRAWCRTGEVLADRVVLRMAGALEALRRLAPGTRHPRWTQRWYKAMSPSAEVPVSANWDLANSSSVIGMT